MFQQVTKERNDLVEREVPVGFIGEGKAEVRVEHIDQAAGQPKVGDKTMCGRLQRQPCSKLLVLLGVRKNGRLGVGLRSDFRRGDNGPSIWGQ